MGTRITININVDVDTADMDELILNQAMLRLVNQGYEEAGIETPEYILDRLAAISREITERNRAELQKRLRTLKLKREGLKTREEKAKDMEAEIAELESKLG
jgi:ABC-type phosphate transport system auxiliary subunit